MIKVDIYKKFQQYNQLFELDAKFHVQNGAITCLHGNSGSGKTTILRAISGLCIPDKGEVEINDKMFFHAAKKINITPQSRNVGMVFQDFALYPFMTVEKNLQFVYKNKTDNHKREKEIVELLEIDSLLERYPNTLSGGQKQRVAIARAILQNPEILLLDEPLTAIHDSLRFQLLELIKKINHEFNLTTIFISHNINEIAFLADEVIHLENGKIVNQYSPIKLNLGSTLSNEILFTGIVNLVNTNDNLIEIAVGNKKINVQSASCNRKINVGEIIQFHPDLISL